MGFDAVEPGALGRQPAGDHLNAFFPLTLRLQGALILLLDPGLDVLTDMPGGVIPDQDELALPLSGNLLAEPLQKVGGHLTDGSAIHEAQSDLSAVRVQHAITTQGFGIGVILAHLQFL